MRACEWSARAAIGGQSLGQMAMQVVRLVKCGCGAAEVGSPKTVRTGKCALGTKVGFWWFYSNMYLIVLFFNYEYFILNI